MKNKVFIQDIENHICCESCMEVYMTTIECPVCENDFSIELEDKEAQCDCGTKFILEEIGSYQRKLTIN